ncbi:MAG TPA: PAS domain S-box protein [Methylomirabilota bacterium]|jgi:PAS domain S-box-containing protein|nr:PAS domain S-box protein [Methylomirabilota bacterium]HEV8615181.1 PAS domain S-box protein [Methylomirabilota bacterium]
MGWIMAYVVAVAVAALAIALKVALALVGVKAPFLLVATAVVVSAWYGGIGPGLVATAIAAMSTAESFLPLSADEIVSIVIFVAEGVLITWLAASLRESNARRGAILRTALDAIVTLDHRGRVVEFNLAAERTFGHDLAHARGRELAELVLPAALRESHRAVFVGGGPPGAGGVTGQRVELTGMRAGGTEFPMELAVTRIETHGRPMFTVHLRDISDRRVAEDAARREEALRSVATLAAATAHEINNPLAVVAGNLELLSLSTELDQRSRQRIERATTAARRIQDIVATMSRITRLEIVGASPRLPDMLDIRRSSE